MSRCHRLEHIEWTRAYENRFDQTPSPENYARDASGAPIWGDGNNGTPDVLFNGVAFDVRNDLSERERESLFLAWDLQGEFNSDWLLESTVSRFSILKDESVESHFNPADPLDDGTGTITAFDSIGWTTFDVKLRDSDLFDDYRFNFVGGYHFSAHQIGLRQFNSTTYASAVRGAQTNASGGKPPSMLCSRSWAGVCTRTGS